MMMAITDRVIALTTGLALLAAATAAWPAEPATATSAPAPAAAASKPAAPTPAPAVKPTPAPLAATMPGGYRLRTVKGEQVYCRTETPIGTTIPKQECYTPETLAEMQKRGHDTAEGMATHMLICGGSACGPN
jgi:hypothetical protein